MSTTSIVVAAVLTTLLINGVAGAAIYLGFKLYRSYVEAKKIAVDLAYGIANITKVVTQVKDELVFMRQVSTGIATPGGHQEGLEEVMAKARAANLANAAGRATIPFPSPNMDRYLRVQTEAPDTPDARVEDTDRSLLEQTDADLVEQEHREELRDRGIEILDDDEVPQGVVAESK
jgi:hypothetical protein